MDFSVFKNFKECTGESNLIQYFAVYQLLLVDLHFYFFQTEMKYILDSICPSLTNPHREINTCVQFSSQSHLNKTNIKRSISCSKIYEILAKIIIFLSCSYCLSESYRILHTIYLYTSKNLSNFFITEIFVNQIQIFIYLFI